MSRAFHKDAGFRQIIDREMVSSPEGLVLFMPRARKRFRVRSETGAAGTGEPPEDINVPE